MIKAELRKIYLERQKKLSAAERMEKSERIAERFFRHFDLRKINFLHCFLPIEKFGEIDTRLIFERIWREFPLLETLVPRVDRARNEIENLRFAPETELIQNSWQIHEPAGSDSVASGKIDLVLVPLLCFDRRGYRVGYGKGFYDRFLKNCRPDCRKFGLSFFPPEELIADVESHDVSLDGCVTPEKIFLSEKS